MKTSTAREAELTLFFLYDKNIYFLHIYLLSIAISTGMSPVEIAMESK